MALHCVLLERRGRRCAREPNKYWRKIFGPTGTHRIQIEAGGQNLAPIEIDHEQLTYRHIWLQRVRSAESLQDGVMSRASLCVDTETNVLHRLGFG